MYWYLIHTKPRQEKQALENLQRQGYVCYLPTIPSEKVHQGLLTIVEQPLFPRYLFIQQDLGDSAKSFAPIRSTKGVSRLVSFGNELARVGNDLIEMLRIQEAAVQSKPEPLFKSGEQVSLAKAPFTGVEGIYQVADGERRVMVLIEMLGKPVVVRVMPASLRKAI